MSKKKYSPTEDKDPKVYDKKRIQNLAEDDYVTSTDHKTISESDMEGSAGKGVTTSEAEGRDAGTIRSLGRYQEESDSQLRERLEKMSEDELKTAAADLGLEADSSEKEGLIAAILAQNEPPIPLAY